MKNRLQKLIIVGLMLGLLAGCTSKEAKQVIQQIDSLGEITLESYNDLQSIYHSYNQLSDADKEQVENIDKFNEANQQYLELTYADLDSRVASACSTVSADSLTELTNLLEEYSSLTDDGKAFITNYPLLEKSISQSKELLAQEKTQYIIEAANGSMADAKSALDENAEIMTAQQVQECLLEIGRWDSLPHAKKLLKGSLKAPDSL